MPDLRVDVEGIDALADRLDGVARGMREARSRVRRDASELGDDAVRRAVEGFADHWDDGLRTLAGNGDDLPRHRPGWERSIESEG